MHPEDLLDRERTGQLSIEQRKRLDQHTAICASCAMIRPMSGAFARELAARGDDDARLARLCDAAINATGGMPLASIEQPVHSYARGRLRRRIGPFAMAAAVLLAGTVATASFWGVRQLFVHRAPPAVPEATAVIEEPHRARAPRAIEHARPAPAPALPEPEVETPEPLPAPRPPVSTHRVAREVTRELPPAPPRVSEEATAERLFASANEARRRGDLSEAARLYQTLQQQHPGSREEITSRVLLARLLLDRDEDTPTALSLFNRYLAASPHGTLAEEARLGKALSLMRLGRRTEERQAWQDLLAAHPNTIHAKRAETRLEELR